MSALNQPRQASANRQRQAAARTAPASTVDATNELLRAVSQHRDSASYVDRVLKLLTEALTTTTTTTTGAPPNDSTPRLEALLQVLEQPEMLADLTARDPLALARIGGLRAKQQLLTAEGGTCTAEQMAQLLGISRQAVDKRRRKGTLIGVSLGRRGYAYPVWQVGLDGLDLVLQALGDLGPWGQLTFMLAGNTLLDGETALAVLRRGELNRVLLAADMLGEQVAA